jgi:hypothetical protein
LIRLNDGALRTPAADIGEQDRPGIARPCLDANLSSPAGEAEDQEHIWLPRQQFSQIAVDRIVGGRKDMTRHLYPDERRAAAARQRRCQATARI